MKTIERIGKLEHAWRLFERLGGLRNYATCEEFADGLRISQRTYRGNIVLTMRMNGERYSETNQWEFYRDGVIVERNKGAGQ